MSTFGPLARRNTGASTSQFIQPSVFHGSWKAEGTSADGRIAALAEYNMMEPSGGRAYFHMLLDASGSTFTRQSGEKKRVYEHLLDHFVRLVRFENALRPSDIIYVWSLNKRTRLLCEVQQKDFHRKVDEIRKEYRNELDGDYYTETRLYDAVAIVMEKIRQTWYTNRKADFFLVPFTDGQDNGSKISVDEMGMKITKFNGGRLHTFFITSNLPSTCRLYNWLQNHQNEMTLIQIENTEPNEISRAFNTLRDLVKAILVVVVNAHGGELNMTRIAQYGNSKADVAESVMRALGTEMNKPGSSLMEAFYSLRTLGEPQ